MLRPSSPVCAKASPRRPCYTLDRSAFVPCPEKNPGMRSDLSVFRINRSCKPANPAFTCQRTFGNRTPLRGFPFQICVSVVTANFSAIISELGCSWPATRSCEAANGGGADRDRTDDLKLAKLALSQLSYGPRGCCQSDFRSSRARDRGAGGPGTS